MTSSHDETGLDAHPLASLFMPKRIALVGASERSLWSRSADICFRSWGFEGEVVAINRRGVDTHGRKGFVSLRDAGTVDAAYLMVPIDSMPEAIADAVDAGVKSAVVLTSGYSELGEDGARLERDLVAQAQAGGMRLMGPNSFGFIDVGRRTAISTLPPVEPTLPGGVALISQSGFTASELMRVAHRYNIGLSFIAATGNEAMVDIADIIDYLIADPATTVIAIYAEGIRHPQRFAEVAARAYAAGKPIVILKVGRSELTAQIAAAHTGSLVGDDRVFDAVCSELGVMRVRNVEDMMITAGLFELTGRVDKPGAAFLSSSGGACTIAADAAGDAGVPTPALAEHTKAQLREVLPAYASTLNPLDLTGGWVNDPDQLGRALEAVSRDPAIGRVLMGFEIPDTAERAKIYQPMFASLGRGLASCDPPGILVSMSMAPATDATRQALADAGIAGYMPGIDATFRALAQVTRWSQPRTAARAANPAVQSPDIKPRTEREVLDLLATFGVPVIPATITRSAAEAAAAIDGDAPLVLKVVSPDITHKTEVGGVRLNLRGAEAVAAAWTAIDESVRRHKPQAKIDGIAISPMRSGGVELIVGAARDPQWGWVLAVGLGGTYVELLGDAALARLPVSAAHVESMLGGLRGAALFKGFRGALPVDLAAVAEVIVHIGEAALALGPDLVSLEVNPLLVNGAEAEALDALAIWSDHAAA